MKITEIIDGIIKREGGYVNNANDKGGPTCWGITEAVARMHGYKGDMRTLPVELARTIYLTSYYIGPGFDKVSVVSPLVAEELADTGVNMGVAVASTFLQRALNVLNNEAKSYADIKVDGHLGPASFSALAALCKARGDAVLIKALNCLQGARYIELAECREKNEAFVYGWLANRVGL